jgi:hypothetical protein
MKHLLNERFFEIAKEYAVNNPKMQTHVCFERANEFLEEYHYLIRKNGEDFAKERNEFKLSDDFEIKDDTDFKKDYVDGRLESYLRKLRELYSKNFGYISAKRYNDALIESLNEPELDF